MKNNMHGNIRNIKPIVQPKPISIGNANFYSTSNSTAPTSANFEDSLNNGKNLIKPSIVSMPTIIKPASSSSLSSLSSNSNNIRKPSPIHVPSTHISEMMSSNKVSSISSAYNNLESTSDESFEDDPPSPPMPSIPPPVLVLDDYNINDDDDQEKESYGIALYDFESDVTEDLNFKVKEMKLYV